MTQENLTMSDSIVLEPPTNPEFFAVHEFLQFAGDNEELRNFLEESTNLTECYERIVYVATKFGYSFSFDDVLDYYTYLVYIEYLNQKVFKPMMDLLNHHS